MSLVLKTLILLSVNFLRDIGREFQYDGALYNTDIDIILDFTGITKLYVAALVL